MEMRAVLFGMWNYCYWHMCIISHDPEPIGVRKDDGIFSLLSFKAIEFIP
jgi:hypothetical protein